MGTLAKKVAILNASKRSMENIRLSCPMQSNFKSITCNLVEPDCIKEFFQGILWNR